jgi:hypothetical protein
VGEAVGTGRDRQEYPLSGDRPRICECDWGGWPCTVPMMAPLGTSLPALRVASLSFFVWLHDTPTIAYVHNRLRPNWATAGSRTWSIQCDKLLLASHHVASQLTSNNRLTSGTVSAVGHLCNTMLVPGSCSSILRLRKFLWRRNTFQ